VGGGGSGEGGGVEPDGGSADSPPQGSRMNGVNVIGWYMVLAPGESTPCALFRDLSDAEAMCFGNGWPLEGEGKHARIIKVVEVVAIHA
jgi:hypothetical protein